MNKLIILTRNKLILLFLTMTLLSSCIDSIDRLKRIGKKPDLATVDIAEIYDDDEEEMERQRLRAERQQAHMKKTNSLWKPGETKFFRDSRAWNVGDIIRVIVEIQDSANLNNSTKQSRDGSDKLGVPKLFGKEKTIAKGLSVPDTKSLLSTSSSRNHTGSGNISRKESIKTEVAAIVTKVLPNGNLVISGHQEVRVNYELREIKIAGIIRPKDISSTNSINTNQIAEARISYGGRGVVSDVQRPRVGSQVLDVISPF